jgi:hypothetical protein
MKKAGRKIEVPYAIQQKVILYFYNNKNNSSKEIAENYRLDTKVVNRILDRHFKKIKAKI